MRPNYRKIGISLSFLAIFLAIFFWPATVQAATCSVQISAKNALGQLIPDAHFEIYQQAYDANNNPQPGKSLGSGTTDKILGYANISFTNAPTGVYVIRVQVVGKDFANFYYYNQNLTCGQNVQITEVLSGMNVIFRDGGGALLKNVNFNLYAQKYDADNQPVKENSFSLGTFNTGDTGAIKIYVPQGSLHSLNSAVGDYYILEATSPSGVKFTRTNIHVADATMTAVNYVFSDIQATLKNALGILAPANTKIQVYNQTLDANGQEQLGAKVGEFSTDNSGQGTFIYHSGIYALVVKDSVGQNNIFWDIEVLDGSRTAPTLITNTTRVTIYDTNDQVAAAGTGFTLYSLVNRDGNYYQDKKISDLNVGASGMAEASLASGPYVAVFTKDYGQGKKVDYGQVFLAANGKLTKITIHTNGNYQITAGQKFKISSATPAPAPTPTPATNIDTALTNRLKGYVVLQTESQGEAWYINPKDGKRYYLPDGEAAYKIMSQLGSGLSNQNLWRIPVGFLSQVSYVDSDQDGLPDKIEIALGTDPNNADTDGDGFKDGTEIRSGNNPLGAGKLPLDLKFAAKQKGILLQVEKNGEAWCVYPADSHRYYMADGASAYQIMRYLGLGITNANLNKIAIGILN